MTVKMKKLMETARIPSYSTPFAAGADLYSAELTIVPARGRKLVHTGIAIELPAGYEAQVRPRSGLALKAGLTVLNTPGTIDEDYRGEVCVILMNHTDSDAVIQVGDRIAQMVVKQYEQHVFMVVNELSETVRNANGFGSTGA